MNGHERRDHTDQRWLQPNELRFWAALAALNGLLLLPSFVLDFQTAYASLAPSIGELQSTWSGLGRWAHAFELVRINVEVILVAAVWAVIAPIRQRTGRWMAGPLFLSILSFHAYESFMWAIYGAPANFFADYHLAKDGLPYLIAGLSVSTPVAVGAVLLLATAVVAICWASLRALITLHAASASGNLGVGSRVAVAAVALVAIVVAAGVRPVHADKRTAVYSTVVEVGRTIQRSVDLRNDVHASAEASRPEFDATTADVPAAGPDVYVIFVESYGSVLVKRPDYEIAYARLTAELTEELDDAGWHVASALSESPTWGGGSWMSYTSALFGKRIDTHPQYLDLLERYSSAREPYPSLPRLLQRLGYQTVWLSPIAKELDDEKWEQYRRFYSVDTWLRHRDFAYEGRQYGWGPAPPDQYVLEYARAEIVNSAEKPVLTVFVTQNSHFPYHAPQLVDDWRTLNRPVGDALGEDSEDVEHQQLRSNYLDAVGYELRMLTQFVVNNADDDAVFVLIGDHQPPRVSRRADSFDTPIHVITRSRGTVPMLTERGFTAGMHPGLAESVMAHEDLYPLLMEVLNSLERH